MNEKFSFLKNHPWFEEDHNSIIGYYVIYRNYDENGGILEAGLINVPTKENQEPMFTYHFPDGEKLSGFHLDGIGKTPDWFQEMYKSAVDKYEKLTRMRKLFKSEAK